MKLDVIKHDKALDRPTNVATCHLLSFCSFSFSVFKCNPPQEPVSYLFPFFFVYLIKNSGAPQALMPA
jgi:hypothetical protein